MKRYIILYLATLAVLVPLDFLFLGVLAKDFFKSQVGGVLGDLKLTPAILFYLVYAAGIVIFVNSTSPNWQHAALYGALFGFFCYATFDLTTLALLRGWPWPAAFVDVIWGSVATAVSATVGLLVANALARVP